MIEKINFSISILLMIVISLLSCRGNSEKKITISDNNNIRTLKNLEWIVDTWQQETSRGPMFETWKIINDSLWKGKAYRLIESDTMILETLSIEIKGDNIYYIPVVPHNEGAVYFKQIEQSGDKVIFENPEHDFPQRIIYSKMFDDSLHVQIEGIKMGVESERNFYFKRVDK
jgi:hypothetical protein